MSMELATLTKQESLKLVVHEQTIEKGLGTFYEVGSALMAIRDARLYRATHRRFADYCNDRWDIQKGHANRLIRSCQIRNDLDPKGSIFPTSETHVRPLLAVAPEARAEVWNDIVDSAPTNDEGEPVITQAHVESVVAARIEPEETEPLSINYTDTGRVVGSLSELSGEKFGTIYADPPWQYGNQGTRAATDNHYATMNIEELCAMPVAEIAADDAHLHLWTTNAFLFDAKSVMEAWGFEYRSCFVWVKTQMGIGNYWRVSHEFLLLGIRGNAKRFNNRSLMSWAEFDRGKHSKKPEEVRGFVESGSPGPYLELFGRRPVECWTVMGNQIDARLFAG